MLLLLAALVHSWFLRGADLRTRCRWRAGWCRRIVRALGIAVDVHGTVPTQGLIVSNHITYLDVLVFGALIEGVFVAKKEVRSWPLIGTLTAFGGTIYVDRSSVRSAVETNHAAGKALDARLPVVIFPEGTSSIGSSVLPFHPTLFDAASSRHAAIWPAAIRYRDEDEEQLAYCDDRTFAPHLVETLRLPRIAATVYVADSPLTGSQRRADSEAAHSAVARLHALGYSAGLQANGEALAGQRR